MFVLDTDVLSLIDQHESGRSDRLILRLEQAAPDSLFATIISFEEQMRGWMSYISQARTISEQIYAYEQLDRHLTSWKRVRTLSFTESAATIAADLRRRHRRLGLMDLRIAAITMAHDATLVTANLRDFALIDDLRIEDWTK